MTPTEQARAALEKLVDGAWRAAIYHQRIRCGFPEYSANIIAENAQPESYTMKPDDIRAALLSPIIVAAFAAMVEERDRALREEDYSNDALKMADHERMMFLQRAEAAESALASLRQEATARQAELKGRVESIVKAARDVARMVTADTYNPDAYDALINAVADYDDPLTTEAVARARSALDYPDATTVVRSELAADVLALAELKGRGAWQPIETAPKDGTEFLAYWDKSKCHDLISWNETDGWVHDVSNIVSAPTHWQAITSPASPDAKVTE